MRTRLTEGQKAYRIAYYQKNKGRICKKIIGEYCYRAIENVQDKCPETVTEFITKYPFEDFAAQRILKQMKYYRIYPSQARYADCYDAGMMAYLYSIHRCAYIGCQNVEAYITKMVRIFLICAMNSFQDSKELCRENNLREVRLDQLSYVRF